MKQSNLIILLVVVGIIIAILAFSMGPKDDVVVTDEVVTDDVNTGLSDLDGDGIANEDEVEDSIETDIEATTGADDVDVDVDGTAAGGAQIDVDIDDADVGTTLENTDGVTTDGTTTGTEGDTRL